MNHHPVWGLAFRPFFLGGSLVGAMLVGYWAWAFFTGDLPTGYFDPINWHAHEMVFGFTIAIIAGFLLTASANWTGTKGVSGSKLMLLFMVWLMGRVAMSLSMTELAIPNIVYALIDLSFIPLFIAVLAPALFKARQLKNIQFVFVLGLMELGNLLMHLASLEWIDYSFASRGLYLGVNIILLILVVIGGRVVPFFTMNALKNVEIHRYDFLDKAVVFSVCAYILVHFLDLEPKLVAWASLLAFILNFAKLLIWKPWKTWQRPLLWILHIGYMWIVIGFLLIYLTHYSEVLPLSVSIHAFTAGAMGTFIMGMMSRVSLGHTGRILSLPKGFVVAYGLITLSGFLRVIFGFIPDYYNHGILASGIFWVLSFALFLAYYYKILTTPRPDGRAG